MTAAHCEAEIWKRDTYRYTGRGKSGFTMHYDRKRCSRRAVKNGLCWQHAKQATSGFYVVRYKWL